MPYYGRLIPTAEDQIRQDAKKRGVVSLALLIGFPAVYTVVFYAVVSIDIHLLLSPVYVAAFGVVVPLLVLIRFWAFIAETSGGAMSVILPVLVSLVVVWCGASQFFMWIFVAAWT